MSHFFLWVMVPKDVAEKGGVGEFVRGNMAPYDAQLETAPHMVDCYCIGRVAKREVGDRADKRCGTWAMLRATFNDRALIKRLCVKGDEESMKHVDSLWRQHAKARIEYERKAISKHPMKAKPDPTCGYYTKDFLSEGRAIGERFEDGSGCGGAGKYLTRATDNGYWDWWVVGGRWDGTIQGNYRMDEKDGGFNFGADHNLLDYNVQMAECLLKLDKKQFDERSPFAILDVDGIWHERGKMLMFGMSSGDKAKDKWMKEVVGYLKQWSDAVVVGVDCHI